VIVLKGPRQIGKTTIQRQLIEHLLKVERIDPRRIFRVQFDELPGLEDVELPLHTLAWWYQRAVLGKTFNEAAQAGEPVYLFLDELQNMPHWSAELKGLVDHHTMHVLLTGSSSLRLTVAQDSLAGRLHDVEMGPLLLREIAQWRTGETIAPYYRHNGLSPFKDVAFWRGIEPWSRKHLAARDDAFEAWSERGGFPVAHAASGLDWGQVAEQLVQMVVQRAIQHDLRMGERGRRRSGTLLEAVFKLACRYTGQSPAIETLVEDLKASVHTGITWQRVAGYLAFLEGAMLLRLISPLEIRLKGKRGPSKFALCDHALRAAILGENMPLTVAGLAATPHLTDLAGRLAESVVGAFLAELPGMKLDHLPARGPDPEVDYIATIGLQHIPIEVKYRGTIDAARDAKGLTAFIEKPANNAPFGVLVTRDDGVVIDDPRIVPVSLPSLLFLR